jgi:phosphopantetheinyl transferase
MPLYATWTENQCSLGLWHITEPEDVLRAQVALLPHDALRLEQELRHPNRRLGFLAGRALLQAMGHPPTQLSYNPGGQPRLPQAHLSLSHTHGWAAVAIAPRPVGIDLERYRQQVLNIRHRMFSPGELAHFGPADAGMLTFLWGAKESLYKLHGRRGLDFRKDMALMPDPEEEPLQAQATVGQHPHQFQARIFGRAFPGGLLVCALANESAQID